MPLYGTSYTTCIGCDTTFKEMLNIKDDCLKQIERTILTGNHNIANVSRTTSTTTTSQSQNILQQWPVSGHMRSVPNSNNIDLTETSRTLDRQNYNISNISQLNRSNRTNTTTTTTTTTTTRNATISNDREDFNPWVNNSNSSENRLDQSVTSRNSNNMHNRTNTWGNIDNDAEIMCKCHEIAIQLTVKKEGPNKGKPE